MNVLVTIGLAITVVGLTGILYSLVKAFKLRQGTLDDKTLRKQLRILLYVNTISLFTAVVGLMVIVFYFILL